MARAVRTMAWISVLLFSAGCEDRYYEIELNNVGTRNIAIQSLEWGDRETALYPGGIHLSAVPPGGIKRGHYNWHVDWPVPERVKVVWTAEGSGSVAREFELRRQISSPDSYKETIVPEFEDRQMRVYTSPSSSTKLPARKLLEIF